MPPAAIVTLVAVGILIAALAFYLIRVILTLRKVIDTLGKITFGLRAIAHATEPVNPILTEIKTDVIAMEGALKALLAKERGAAEPELSTSGEMSS
ncbi:MAG: hypothetical protein HKN91_14085 [Acidimicrobiia bacterium]|nr:hypothetical protein [Acidimicrobiia bacterium]